MTTNEYGRELLIRFTCQRCKNTVIVPYGDVMIGEHYGFLRNSRLPQDWDTIGYSTIACPDCVAAFKQFMHPAREVDA